MMTVSLSVGILVDGDQDSFLEIRVGLSASDAMLLPGNPQVAEAYLPIVHLVFSNLKTWLAGIHHGVSYQHPQAYLSEFTFRFNRRFCATSSAFWTASTWASPPCR
jgi:hypothetical protein